MCRMIDNSHPNGITIRCTKIHMSIACGCHLFGSKGNNKNNYTKFSDSVQNICDLMCFYFFFFVSGYCCFLELLLLTKPNQNHRVQIAEWMIVFFEHFDSKWEKKKIFQEIPTNMLYINIQIRASNLASKWLKKWHRRFERKKRNPVDTIEFDMTRVKHRMSRLIFIENSRRHNDEALNLRFKWHWHIHLHSMN